MNARRLLAWCIVAEVVATFLLVAWLAPASPRGSLVAPSWSTSFQPMEPIYVYLSWISAFATVFAAVLLDADLWED